MISEFNGFHRETLDFLSELKKNNDKEWFEKNKDRYEKQVMEPSRAFVTAMGARLMEISEDIVADPRVNKSLFRLNRDVRFSQDKSPYKTHIGILFWEGPRKRMECPSFYFHIETDSLMLGSGLYMLPKDMIDPYRNVVSQEGPAEELAGIIAEMNDHGIEVGGLHYKNVPRGYDVEHSHPDLLKYNGVYGMVTTGISDELFTSDILEISLGKYRLMDPLNRWLLKYLY
ncbi:MAG: DUF2461 domain-containing protein [Thermoplasmatota archaeon]